MVQMGQNKMTLKSMKENFVKGKALNPRCLKSFQSQEGQYQQIGC
jgi:hypothetical protein